MESEYYGQLFFKDGRSVKGLKIKEIREYEFSEDILYRVHFYYLGHMIECTRFWNGDEKFEDLGPMAYTDVVLEMRHLILYEKEDEKAMGETKELLVRAGDFIKVKPYRSVRDPETGAVCGIPKNIYFDFEVNPPRVRNVKWHCGLITHVSIVGYDEKWYQLTPDYIDGVISQSDSVNHPAHYNQNGMEVLDVIKAFTSNLSGAEAFYAGNAIKYILRWDKKNGIEDLEKAKVYINKIIEGRKEENGKIS